MDGSITVSYNFLVVLYSLGVALNLFSTYVNAKVESVINPGEYARMWKFILVLYLFCFLFPYVIFIVYCWLEE